ncbi:MAG: TRAP transporter small permease subunit [Deltaproteobacteria bacterium]|jgi:TRAP-type mannitol/chloroaromatic compound transport system permease small subunit|nr:TRAP transporter small permease subunit [Deltaproteobacteria bacterium]
MEKFFHIIDRTSGLVGKGASFLVVILVIAIGYDITLRYFFNIPCFWSYDMTIMLYGSYAILGTAYCHYRNGHVRMDLLYGRLSRRGRAIMDIICYIFLFFPLFTVLIWKCGNYAFWSLINGERSSASAWRPVLGPFNMVIVLGLILFFLQGLVDFLRNIIFVVKGGKHES